jgi:hypothetical protein
MAPTSVVTILKRVRRPDSGMTARRLCELGPSANERRKGGISARLRVCERPRGAAQADFRLIFGLSEHLFGDGRKLHIRGTLIDFADFGVAVELLDRVLASEADAAEQVDGGGGGLFGDL